MTKAQIVRCVYDVGINIFPVMPDKKKKLKPLVTWKEYQSQRVTIEQIKEWMKIPDIPGFGMVTGACPWSDTFPGIVVVDADNADAFSVVWERCPETPVKTMTGRGEHWIYRHPGYFVPNRQKTKLGGSTWDIDIRGDGGFAVSPGTLHPLTGKLYEWAEPWSLDLFQEAPVYDPAWLPCEQKAERAAEVRKSRQRASERPLRPVTTPDGKRIAQGRAWLEHKPGCEAGRGADSYCFALAVQLLHGFALDTSQAEQLLFEWGQRDDQVDEDGRHYPWSPEQIAHKIAGASQVEYDGEVGDLLNRELMIEDFITEFFKKQRGET